MKKYTIIILLSIMSIVLMNSCCRKRTIGDTTPGDGTCPNGCPYGAICSDSTCNCPEGQYNNGGQCFSIPDGYILAEAPGEPCSYDHFVFKIDVIGTYTPPQNNATIVCTHAPIGGLASYIADPILGDTFTTNPFADLISPCQENNELLYPQWTGRFTPVHDSLRLTIFWREYSTNNTGAIHRIVKYNCKVY